MKRTYVNLIQKSLAAMCLVFGMLLFGTSRAEAQTDQSLSLNWLTESEALSALEGAVNTYVADQGNFTVGSAAWINAANHIEYYKLLMGAIEGGAQVGVAVNTVVIAGYDPNPVEDYSTVKILAPATMGKLRSDATDLLTQ